jgi:hypothetical protein
MAKSQEQAKKGEKHNLFWGVVLALGALVVGASIVE